MWLQWSCRRAGTGSLWGLAVLFATGCSDAHLYTLGQPIEMGPWTFEVESVTDRVDARGGARWKTVTVVLRLHNYTERHELTFDDFLNGDRPGSMIIFPRMRLVDAEGDRFDGLVHPVSGGSSRSERWRAEFLLVPSGRRYLMTSSSELAARYLESSPSDFRLVIHNPDRRPGQPRRVGLAPP